MKKPLWRRIVEFPLVAMVLALAVILLAIVPPVFAVFALGKEWDEATFEIVLGPLIALASFLAYKLVVTRMGREPRDDLPLGKEAFDVVRGTLIAGSLMTAIVGVVWLAGGYRIEGWGGGSSWAMMLFVAGLQAAVFEEILARGIIFRFLEELGGSWLALILSSLIFGFLHAMNENASLWSSLAISLEAGILLGGAYMLTRNLWLAIGLHFGWNVVQGLVWDAPVSGMDVDGIVEANPVGPELVSGGAFGLEASAIAAVMATAVGLYIVWLAVQRGHVVKPMWHAERTHDE